MAIGTSQIEIAAPCSVVFDLIHDYSRRLEWDPFLRSATLLRGATQAGLGVVSRCSAKYAVGGLSMETEYVSFDPPKVAAVRLVKGPWCFKTFAATIRHAELEGDRSTVTYKFNFTTAPASLSFLLDPLIKRIFHRETSGRLRALKGSIESGLMEATTVVANDLSN